MNDQHDLLKELLGGNYVGPVGEILARRPLQRQIRVLDLCTGTGKWYVTPSCIFIQRANRRCHLRRVVEMAEEFPHVKFNGLDIGVLGMGRHSIAARLNIPMQLRSPRGLHQRTSSSKSMTSLPRLGSLTRPSISFTQGTAVFSLYVTLSHVHHSSRFLIEFHVTGSRLQRDALRSITTPSPWWINLAWRMGPSPGRVCQWCLPSRGDRILPSTRQRSLELL